jgi:hypothetical protein
MVRRSTAHFQRWRTVTENNHDHLSTTTHRGGDHAVLLTIFVLDEFYESPAGVVEHWKQAVESWQDLSAFMEWSKKAKRVSTLHSGTLVQALW